MYDKRVTLIGNRVLLRLIEEPETTAGGLYMPEKHRARATRGTVLAVGPGIRSPTTGALAVVPGVRPGEVVAFNRHADDEVTIDGERLAVVDAREVLGVLEYTDADSHPDRTMGPGRPEVPLLKRSLK